MIKTTILKYESSSWIEKKVTEGFDESKCQLVLVFGQKTIIPSKWIYDDLRERFPNAEIVFSSTSGEIIQNRIYDNSIAVAALQFEKTNIKSLCTLLSEHKDSKSVGLFIYENLQAEDLAGIIIFSDGIHINGSELVEGLNEKRSKSISISGGLAGDENLFSSTLVGLNSSIGENRIVAIGLYGKDITIGHGSLGGWDEFGHQRIVTKADKNVLYELDGKNALNLYKEYLGPYSEELPASALLFPLSLRANTDDETLIRTILTIDEQNQTMTFAGNLPVGSKVRFMKANFDKLIEASSLAAKLTFKNSIHPPDFALLISCIGRKLILQERTEEEIEAATEILGNNCASIGYYSYGELSPFNNSSNCELHNQTMTITTLIEK